MECDSIMEISLILNIDDISALNDVSMEVSTPVTPAPESWIPPHADNKSEIAAVTENSALEKMKKFFTTLPNGTLLTQNIKANLAASSEKQKALEAEVAHIKMKLEAQKKAVAEENSKLRAAREETKKIDSKLSSVQNKIKSLTKEMEDLKKPTSSSDKENISEKCRVELYRQLSGVTFGYNKNTPNELKGFVAGVGSGTNLKTFSFNTAEHSSSLIGGYLWNVLEDINKKNWEHLVK